jgi:hypothetical protein
MVVALRPADLAGDRPSRALERVDPDQGGQQRGSYHLTSARAVSLVEGREHSVGAVHAGEQVTDRHPDLLRLLR